MEKAHLPVGVAGTDRPAYGAEILDDVLKARSPSLSVLTADKNGLEFIFSLCECWDNIEMLASLGGASHTRLEDTAEKIANLTITRMGL